MHVRQRPLVTVLMPVFNAERFVGDALASVVSQSYDNLEILVVDDGSTDRSLRIVERLRQSDPRIRVHRQANGGISAALNAGLAIANGSLIARMDADDLMLPRRIEEQVAFLQANPDLGFCGSFLELIGADGRAASIHRPEPVTRESLQRLVKERIVITYTHPSVMMHADLARRLGGYKREFEPCEDMELFLRMIEEGRPGLIIPRVLMRYRLHPGSISGSKTLRQIMMMDLVEENFYRRLDGGRELDPRLLQDHVLALPYPRRMAYRIGALARALRQQASYDRANGRTGRYVLRMIVGGLLRPQAVLRRILRRGPFASRRS
jgi:glycosyltransferase involved in cell wall biosynthesis